MGAVEFVKDMENPAVKLASARALAFAMAHGSLRSRNVHSATAGTGARSSFVKHFCPHTSAGLEVVWCAQIVA